MPITPIFLVGAPNSAQPDNQPNLNLMVDQFCNFAAATKSTLHMAAYHFKFFGDSADKIRKALSDVAERADVKIAYFDEPKKSYSGHQALYGGDSSGPSVFTGYEHTKVQLKAIQSIDIHDLPEGVQPAPIEGDGALMHSKYMIRDNKDVWMGSANFTQDGWGLQDNNVLLFTDAADLAKYYTTDFEDLWHYGRIAGTGKDDHGTPTIAGDQVEVDFSPGDGKSIDQRLAELIDSAKTSVFLASMDITSRLVLEALDKALDRVKVVGVYDGPQMTNVEHTWGRSSKSDDVAKVWQRVKAKLVAKNSKPFNPHAANAFYNFMHNKALVVDDKLVHTGSFNFSSNATRNAENVVNVTDAALAKQYSDYIQKLYDRYKNGGGV